MMWCKQHVFVCLVVMMFTSCATTRKSIGREGVNDDCQFVCLDNEITGLQFSDNRDSLKIYIEIGAGLPLFMPMTMISGYSSHWSP